MHFLHEPPARMIGQPHPVYTTLNKSLHYITLQHLSVAIIPPKITFLKGTDRRFSGRYEMFRVLIDNRNCMVALIVASVV